jgi:hypothetical protein
MLGSRKVTVTLNCMKLEKSPPLPNICMGSNKSKHTDKIAKKSVKTGRHKMTTRNLTIQLKLLNRANTPLK